MEEELNDFEKELLAELDPKNKVKQDWIDKVIENEVILSRKAKAIIEHNLSYEEFVKGTKTNRWPPHTEKCAICGHKIDIKDEVNLHRVSVVKQDKILDICLDCGQGDKYQEWVLKD